MNRLPREEFLRLVENNQLEQLDCLPQGLEVREDVTFRTTRERPLKLDLYVAEAPRTLPRPAILFLHGGGWLGGSKKQFARQAAYLAAKHGFLAVCSEYRFSSEAAFPACLEDARCAVKWIRGHGHAHGVDPERVAVAGGSAGGHLAAMLATTAHVLEYEPADLGGADYADQLAHVNLCIPHNAPLDLVKLAEVRGPALNPVSQLVGRSLAEAPEAYRAASPYHRADARTAPMLLLHGRADTTVPCEQSVAFQQKLLSLGVHSELEMYPDKAHGWFNRAPDFAPVLKRLEAFLTKQFGLL